MRVSYAIIFVSDMPRSIAFYRDVARVPDGLGISVSQERKR